jgi:hypothetical protein
MSRIAVSSESGGIVVEVEGSFCCDDALELQRRLEALPLGPTVIDFSRVKSFSDAAIPWVVRAIGRRPCRLRGLVQHQERMLRYFGVPGSEEQVAGAA